MTDAGNSSPPLLGLISGPEIAKQLRARRSAYIFVTVPKDKERVQKHQADGWEIERRNKKSVRMKKLKAHDVALEDRVWVFLAKLGWKWMNKDRKFRIAYEKIKQGKQIDAFAADSETALIVECKSRQSWKTATFRDEILEIQSLKRGVNATIRESFDRTPKTAWLFVTNHYRISDETREHFKVNNIHHISEAELSYYEQLVDHLGPVAKYQLFGRLFSGIKIPDLDTRLPAIRGKLGGHIMYCFLAEAELLLKVGYVLHRTSELELEDVESYQRLVSKARMKEIKNFLEKEGGFFANSILLNIRTKKQAHLRFDLAGGGDHASSANIGIVHLPKTYQSAMVIDGQHRLFGYGHTERRQTDTLPVVAFCNLPGQTQQELFVEINAKQKPVPKNLLLTLTAAFDFDSDEPSIAKPAAVTRLLELMNTHKGSYLYKRIVLAEEKKTPTSVTLRYLKGEGLDKTSILASIEKGKLIEGHCWATNWTTTVRKAYKFLNLCMGTIYEVKELGTQWERGNGPGGFISMNSSLSALFIVIDDIVNHLVAAEGIQPSTLSPEKLHARVRPSLDSIALYLLELGDAGIDKLRRLSGGGGSATRRILRQFQDAIHMSDSSFTPVGFLQWKEEGSFVYTDKTEPLTTGINIALKDYCWRKMQAAHGVQKWLDYIPEKTQQHLLKEYLARGRKEPKENYLSLIHYQGIILDNLDTVFDIDVFTSPEQKNKSVADKKKLDWFFTVADARSKCSHPERDIVTEEAYNVVREVHQWLLPRLQKGAGGKSLHAG